METTTQTKMETTQTKKTIEELPPHTVRLLFHVCSAHRTVSVLALTPKGLVPLHQEKFDRCVVVTCGGST